MTATPEKLQPNTPEYFEAYDALIKDMARIEGEEQEYINATHQRFVTENPDVQSADDSRWQMFRNSVVEALKPLAHSRYQRAQEFIAQVADHSIAAVNAASDQFYKTIEKKQVESLPDIKDQIHEMRFFAAVREHTHKALVRPFSQKKALNEPEYVTYIGNEISEQLMGLTTNPHAQKPEQSVKSMRDAMAPLHTFRNPLKDENGKILPIENINFSFDMKLRSIAVSAPESLSDKDLATLGRAMITAIQAELGENSVQQGMFNDPKHPYNEFSWGLGSGAITKREYVITLASPEHLRAAYDIMYQIYSDSALIPINYAMKHEGMSFAEAYEKRKEIAKQFSAERS